MVAKPNDTPSWAKIIKDAIRARLLELHTAMPATIESYDPQTGYASVAPCLKRKYRIDNLPVDLPVIPNVPVVMPRAAAGDAYISLPLQKGDPVTLVFSERSLDKWKTSGGKVDPADPRMHALSDAFAFPGGYPKGATPMTAANANDLIMACGDAVTSLKQDGSIVLENDTGTTTIAADGGTTIDTGAILFTLSADGKFSAVAGGVDLYAQILKVLDNMMTKTKVATAMGLQPFIPDPSYVTDRGALDAFKA